MSADRSLTPMPAEGATTTSYDIAGRVATRSSASAGGGVSTVGSSYQDDGRVSTEAVLTGF